MLDKGLVLSEYCQACCKEGLVYRIMVSIQHHDEY